ncbi:ATP-binding protein [Chlorobium sp. N1]|uniref:ATP-binding protein n=1 Tax=Chlorobium sp. N1 TaxID=2491138 RepID=UPI001038725A|nr:ATP-binding protein [Chlorobium sp. N1]TCD47505.1 PAS domain S-box protein [Chlorobium sp. N1]
MKKQAAGASGSIGGSGTGGLINSLFESTSDPILSLVHAGRWVWDVTTNANEWSEELWPLYGLAPHSTEPSYASWRQTVSPEDRDAVEAAVHNAVSKGTEFNSTWRVNLPEAPDEVRWLMSKGTPIRDEEGRTVRYAGIVFDITEWMRAEEIRRESQAWFNAVFDSNSAVKLILDPLTGRIIDANGCAQRYYGWTLAQLPSLHISQIHVQPREALRMLLGAWEERQSQRFEFRHRRADHSIRDVEAFGSRICIHGRTYVYLIINDMTERKRLESLMAFRLRLFQMSGSAEEPELLRATLDEAERLTGSTIGFCRTLEAPLIAEARQVRVWSSNTMQHECRMEDCEGDMGMDMDGIPGKVLREGKAVIHNDFKALKPNRPLPHGHCDVERVLIVPLMEGSAVTAVFGVGNCPYDYTEEDATLVSNLAGFARDIIARKQAERAEQAMQEQLNQSQKLDLVGRLAGGIAHDYNNMLAITLGHVEILLEQVSETHPFFNGLQAIRNSTERSALITSQLLAFARKQTNRPAVMKMNTLVEECLPMIRGAMGESITCAWHPGPESLSVLIDPGQFSQILINLCFNARDAIQGNGTITVTAADSRAAGNTDKQAPASAVLTVTDSGAGIPEHLLPHIFEPFFTTKEVGKGTGLGLSSVYGIVKQNNGQVACTTEPDTGTTFSVSFPLYAEASGTEAPADADASGSEGESGRKILIVEDEPDILHLVRKILEKNGYLVRSAPDAESALTLNWKGSSLLLTDVMLPGMNGVQLYERMHAADPELQCLFISGFAPERLDHPHRLQEGVNFIRKPFSIKDLLRLVQRKLQPPPPSGQR